MRGLDRYILMVGLLSAWPALAAGYPSTAPANNAQVQAQPVPPQQSQGGQAEPGAPQAHKAAGSALGRAWRATIWGLKKAAHATGQGIEKAGQGVKEGGHWVAKKTRQ